MWKSQVVLERTFLTKLEGGYSQGDYLRGLARPHKASPSGGHHLPAALLICKFRGDEGIQSCRGKVIPSPEGDVLRREVSTT